MSDRVRFATFDYRLGLTETNNIFSSKFSGFPFRVVENDGSAVGAGTYYQLALTADQAMQLFWRIRNLELDTDGSISDADEPPSVFFFLIQAPLDGHSATRERDLCISSPNTSGVDSGTLSGFTYSVLNTVTLFQNDAVKVPCYKVGSTYYPRIDILSQLSVEVSPNVNHLIVSSTPVFSAYYSGSFSGSFGPHTLTYYWAYDDPMILPKVLTYFDINFLSYWPYAASDGSPIYNTSTGAQLQDPRN